MNKTKIGYSKGIITAKTGLGLAGYGSMTRKATGVHDDLYTRVLLIESEGETFLIVQNDLLSIDSAFANRVANIAADCGINNSNNVFTGTTHTHSGPKGTVQDDEKMDEVKIAIRGRYDSELCENIFEVIKNSINEAMANKSPALLSYGFSEVADVGTNRNNAEVPCDKTLLAMEFVRDDGKKLLLYNFSCHPTTLNMENTLYTADWPYGVTKRTEGLGYEMVMFLNGSAGDISTRFTRNSPTFEEADRLGGILYDGITNAIESPACEELHLVKSAVSSCKLKLRAFGSVEEAKEKLAANQNALNEAKARGETALRVYESRVEGAKVNLGRAEASAAGQNAEEIELTLKVLKLNDFVFIFVPGELFSALTLPLRSELGKKLVFCTYFNDCTGYIADSDSHDKGTYEALSSPFKKGEGEKLMDKVREIVLTVN